MDPAGRWKERHAGRLAWASNARREYLTSLGPEIGSQLAQEGTAEAHVVVYGKTQVGKTSLILDLMGVASDAQPRVSGVLRGGREDGNSATAVATAYRRAPDDRWHLQCSSEEVSLSGDEAMVRALAAVRERMSLQGLSPTDQCTVFIPASCFAPDASGLPHMRILDLPGVQARDPTEDRYVREVARHRVPYADLILLVGKADDLSFLKPGALDVPGIEDWQLTPERFRVVTTYSFTLESLLRLAAADPRAWDADALRARLLGELVRSEIALAKDARRLELFFPLEFGDSWRNGLLGDQGELFRTLTPLVDGLKAQLRNDIAAATGDYARFENTYRAHVVVARLKQRRLQEWDRQIGQAEKRCQEAENEVSFRAEKSNEVHRRRIELCEMQERLTEEQLTADIEAFAKCDERVVAGQLGMPSPQTDAPPETFREAVRIYANEQRVSAFQILLDRFASVLLADAIERRPPRDSFLSTWLDARHRVDADDCSAALDKIIGAALAEVRSILARRWGGDKYPSSWRLSNWTEDKLRVEDALEEASRAVDAYLQRLWMRQSEVALNRLREHIHQARRACAAADLKALEAKQAYAVCAQECRQLIGERDDFRSKMAAHERSGERFLALLDRHYLDNLRERRRAFHQGACAPIRLVELLSCQHLVFERKKLLDRFR